MRKWHPNWKIHVLLRHYIIVCKDAIFLGSRLSCDEETMGCKGRHPDILRINYKKEGDGFQCGALVSDGYTYTFFFRNQPAPQSYLDQDLCLLHARVMALLDQVVSKNHTIGMDNLYISANFFWFGWQHPDRFMFHGVAWEKGRGVPSCLFQKKETSKIALVKIWWTLKATTLKGDPSIPGIVELSLFDSKPFYFMSNACEVVKRNKMMHKVWSKEKNRMAKMPFSRYNMIHDYNIGMNTIDLADQIRNTYLWDLFMRKRKWWWSIMMWCLQMLPANPYILAG